MFQDFKAVLPPFVLLVLGGVMLGIFVHPAFFLLSLVGFADTCGRYKDYFDLRWDHYDVEEGHCVIPFKVGDYYGRSFCGRWLIKTLDPAYTDRYHANGYRWWHLFPQGTPWVFFRVNFWRNLAFGHPAAKSKNHECSTSCSCK